jgi:hypothetical protein
MFQLNEKHNSTKKHITKLNLNLQLGVNLNTFNNNNTSNPNINNTAKQSVTNSKKWNLFSPKVPDKKYAFDFIMNKNSRFQSNYHINSGMDLFLKLNFKTQKNKNDQNHEENKNKANNDIKPNSSDIRRNYNYDKFQINNIRSINNPIEDGNVINREEIYNMSKVKYLNYGN